MAAGSSAAVAISVIALAEAEKAKCAASVKGYRHDVATVAQMQEYAGCIDKLHPSELTADATIVLKVAIVLLFAGTIGGGVYQSVWGYDGPITGALLGLAATAGGMLALWLAWAGIKFLLS